MPTRTRSLVIPMRNEASRIGRALEILVESGLCDDRLELLLVDDGSTDSTAEVAEAVIAGHGLLGKVLRQGVNRGKGVAVREGLLQATGATRVFVDADLPVAPDDVERCFVTLEDGEADVVYGTRAHPDSRVLRRQPVLRVAASRAFSLWLRALGLAEDPDTQCGLKGVTAEAATLVVAPLVTEGYAFDVELLTRADRARLQVTPVPVQWSHVAAGNVLPLRDGLAAARAAWRIRSLLR
ncbi:MAG TPA: glycosyltransferase [Acidimicrobiales bacterium]|nr:glycosyltransferase [Acidimicrobiales bacterium]